MAGDVPIAALAPGPPAAARTRRCLRRRRRHTVRIGPGLLPLGAVRSRRASSSHLGEGLAQGVRVARERRVRRQREIHAEDADVVRRFLLRAEIVLRRLHGQALRFGAQPIEDERGDDRSVVDGRRRNRVRADRGSRRRSRRGRDWRRRVLEDRRERPELLDHAVLEDLEISGSEIADRQSPLVADDHVDQHGRHALAHRPGPLRCRLLLGRPRRGREQDEQGDPERHSQCGHFPPTDCAPLRCVRASRSSLENSARSRAASSSRPARW